MQTQTGEDASGFYKYDTLGHNEIRVFDILRKEEESVDDAIRIRIRKISLNDPEAYYTLSYTWRTPHARDSYTMLEEAPLSHTVFESGRHIKVTQNLFEGLLRIRYLWDTWYDEMEDSTEAYRCNFLSRQRRWTVDTNASPPIPGSSEYRGSALKRPPLWVDALCINQGDHREQSSQVKMMASIYKLSAHLLIWLGKRFSGYDLHFSPHDSDSSDDSGDESFTFKKIQNSAVVNMLYSSWFTRTWVVQEALVKLDGCSIIQHRGLLPRVEFNLIKNTYNNALDANPVDAKSAEDGTTYDLLFNLDKYSNKSCSDPRDRVYALLSISSDGAYIPVDYSKSYLDVYTTVARSYIERGIIGRVFVNALLRQAGANDGSWPSWVPDWSVTTISNARHWRPATSDEAFSIADKYERRSPNKLSCRTCSAARNAPRDFAPDACRRRFISTDHIQDRPDEPINGATISSLENVLHIDGWLLYRCNVEGENINRNVILHSGTD